MDMGSRRRGGGSDVLVDELASKIEKFVRITDLPEIDSSDDGDDNSDDLEGYEPYGPEPSKKEKSAAFSSPRNVFSSVASSDEEAAASETGLQLLFPDVSEPLLSALKGSREKQGAEPKKLSVTWAPDVYDPIPNSLSHSVGTKQKKSRKDKDRDNSNNNYKKNGKKGQKGNSSRASGGGKDKKQFRGKHGGGRSAKGYKTMGADDDDIDVGSPDFCGSSFLKASSSEFHYSLAEAL
ncbi:hypothetical protein Tsubulata_027561 [Turnera subulata]|uniref:Uncharacterized protein n=1 Tax=Turnera subulata TaxID=218843 RepID=A0A9Q0J312_9ROSI|nr:hypothetical protein Tsubulata_027561 [Turnera subulata]